MSARNGNPKMQRAHFQLIADVVSEFDFVKEYQDGVRQSLAEEFAKRLALTNDSFDRDRFIRACFGDLTK